MNACNRTCHQVEQRRNQVKPSDQTCGMLAWKLETSPFLELLTCFFPTRPLFPKFLNASSPPPLAVCLLGLPSPSWPTTHVDAQDTALPPYPLASECWRFALRFIPVPPSSCVLLAPWYLHVRVLLTRLMMPSRADCPAHDRRGHATVSMVRQVGSMERTR